MRFIRAAEIYDDRDHRDDGWFDEFCELVDEIVAARLLMDDMYVTGREPVSAGISPVLFP